MACLTISFNKAMNFNKLSEAAITQAKQRVLLSINSIA